MVNNLDQCSRIPDLDYISLLSYAICARCSWRSSMGVLPVYASAGWHNHTDILHRIHVTDSSSF